MTDGQFPYICIPGNGGCQDDDTLVLAEAVHLHQHLVQGLFLFVMTAAQTGAALAAYGIDLIDEDDGRGYPLGLIKEITDTAGTYAHIQFHKIGTGNGQKLHIGLTGCCPGKPIEAFYPFLVAKRITASRYNILREQKRKK